MEGNAKQALVFHLNEPIEQLPLPPGFEKFSNALIKSSDTFASTAAIDNSTSVQQPQKVLENSDNYSQNANNAELWMNTNAYDATRNRPYCTYHLSDHQKRWFKENDNKSTSIQHRSSDASSVPTIADTCSNGSHPPSPKPAKQQPTRVSIPSKQSKGSITEERYFWPDPMPISSGSMSAHDDDHVKYYPADQVYAAHCTESFVHPPPHSFRSETMPSCKADFYRHNDHSNLPCSFHHNPHNCEYDHYHHQQQQHHYGAAHGTDCRLHGMNSNLWNGSQSCCPKYGHGYQYSPPWYTPRMLSHCSYSTAMMNTVHDQHCSANQLPQHSCVRAPCQIPTYPSNKHICPGARNLFQLEEYPTVRKSATLLNSYPAVVPSTQKKTQSPAADNVSVKSKAATIAGSGQSSLSRRSRDAMNQRQSSSDESILTNFLDSAADQVNTEMRKIGNSAIGFY